MASGPDSVLSTGSVAPEDAFSYWSDLICAEFVQLEARPKGAAGFTGSIEHDTVDSLSFSVVSADAQRVDRTRRLIAASAEEVVLVSIQLAGTGTVRQAGRFARIFGPEGTPLGEDLAEDEEGLVVADLDFSLIAIAKSAADPVGHYSRPDVLRLYINRAPAPRVVETSVLPVAAEAVFAEGDAAH